MIDLNKMMYWACVLSVIWFIGWMSHIITIRSVSREINRLVPVHVPEVSYEPENPFPIGHMNQLDSIAFCHALIIRTSND